MEIVFRVADRASRKNLDFSSVAATVLIPYSRDFHAANKRGLFTRQSSVCWRRQSREKRRGARSLFSFRTFLFFFFFAKLFPALFTSPLVATMRSAVERNRSRAASNEIRDSVMKRSWRMLSRR